MLGAPASSRLVGEAHAWTLAVLNRGDEKGREGSEDGTEPTATRRTARVAP